MWHCYVVPTLRHHSPREREVHETEHRAREKRDGVRPVEEVDGDVFYLLLVYHAEMHPIVDIVLTESLRSVRGRHARPLMFAALLHLRNPMHLRVHAPSASNAWTPRANVRGRLSKRSGKDDALWDRKMAENIHFFRLFGEARARAMESRVGQTR